MATVFKTVIQFSSHLPKPQIDVNLAIIAAFCKQSTKAKPPDIPPVASIICVPILWLSSWLSVKKHVRKI